jgi:hypothetical protein
LGAHPTPLALSLQYAELLLHDLHTRRVAETRQQLMGYLVCVNHDGLESTLGPFDLETAEATVTRLACAPATRERFAAYVIPVPDDAAQRQDDPVGLDG